MNFRWNFIHLLKNDSAYTKYRFHAHPQFFRDIFSIWRNATKYSVSYFPNVKMKSVMGLTVRKRICICNKWISSPTKCAKDTERIRICAPFTYTRA